MNIQQWKARIQDAKTRAELLKLQDYYSEELRAKGEKMKGLMKHAGWKIIEEYFDQQELLLRDQLELARITDVVSIQTELKVLKKFRTFLKNTISQLEN